MKLHLTLIRNGLLLVAFCTATAGANAADMATVISDSVPQIIAATVQIESREELSSGVLISPTGHVLTVAHGISAEADTVKVRLSTGSRLQARVLVRNAKADVAVLQLQLADDARPLMYVRLASEIVAADNPVLACGFAAREGRAAAAVVRYGQLVASGKQTVRSSCMLTAGDSGGPLVNASGALLGIHQRIGLGRNSNLHVNLATCAAAVKDQLDLLSIATTAAESATEVQPPTVSAAALDQWQNSAVTIWTAETAQRSADESAPQTSATDSSVTDSTVTDSTVTDSTVTDSSVTLKPLAWGTVLNSTIVVTKFSSLPPEVSLTVKTHRDVSHAARLVRHSQPLDLAVLQLTSPLEEPAAAASAALVAEHQPVKNSLQVGQLMFSNRAADISILTRISHHEPRSPPKLGVGLRLKSRNLTVDAVSANSAASDMGLRLGDRLQSLQQRAVKRLDDVAEVLDSLQPGDYLSAKVVRQQQPLIRFGRLRHAPATLLSRTEFLDGNAGSLSPRRTGFKSVLQHDAILSARQMGGPVCDLNGTVIGINIARRARESVLAVPLATVSEFAAEYLTGE